MSQKKIHARGFSENVNETRASRVGFKRYLRELEESLIDEEDEDVDFDDCDLDDEDDEDETCS